MRAEPGRLHRHRRAGGDEPHCHAVLRHVADQVDDGVRPAGHAGLGPGVVEHVQPGRRRRARVVAHVHRHGAQHVDETFLEQPGPGELQDVACEAFGVFAQQARVAADLPGYLVQTCESDVHRPRSRFTGATNTRDVRKQALLFEKKTQKALFPQGKRCRKSATAMKLRDDAPHHREPRKNKSFLVLFFKKEPLAYLPVRSP